MPIYPALALLIGSALAGDRARVRRCTVALIAAYAALSLVLTAILMHVWRRPVPLDISVALTQNPVLYTLSLGHMFDLTTGAFAYLKLPLALAAMSFGVGAVAIAILRRRLEAVVLTAATAMVVFFGAARLALIRFDPYLGSYSLAVALREGPPGTLIEGDAYYAFSSVFFYAHRSALLWNGRYNNFEYGSYAPGASQVFIGDQQLARLWRDTERCYLLVYGSDLPRLQELLGRDRLHVVKRTADNYLLTNLDLP